MKISPSQEEPNVDTQVFRRQQILGGCLIVEVGRGASSRYHLRTAWPSGGVPSATWSQMSLMSRIHARISKGREWVIEDSNSTNGPFVNGTW